MNNRNGVSALQAYLCALLLLLLPSILSAQADRGTITGLVTDSTGAVVPGVEVIATHTATNIQTTTTTNESGNYVLMRLPTGTYALLARKAGFRTNEWAGVAVRVDQTTRIDVKLEIGQIAETVNVTARAELLQSESAEVGTTVSSARFTELPMTLGGTIRNPSAFLVLNPGVRPGDTWGKALSGGPAGYHQVYYDGIALSRGDYANDAEINPSVDAIEEFKLVSSNYSAEFSHAMSGVTSFIMKSGTNTLHGSLLFFNSIEKYNARSFFQSTKPPYRRNEWGFTVGGPVVIPKLYNGRNKTFFFFNLDQFYNRNPGGTGRGTIATPRVVSGDFGEWAAAGLGAIYDPSTGRRMPDGSYVRDPFSNNIIPSARFSSVAKKIVPYIPLPQYAGLTQNHDTYATVSRENDRASGFKIDEHIQDAHRLSGMFNYTDNPRFEGSTGGSIVPSVDNPLNKWDKQHVTTRLVRLNYDWIISPSVLNHFGAGLSRFRNPTDSTDWNKGYIAQIGLKGVAKDMFPAIAFSHDYSSWTEARTFNFIYTNFTFTDIVSVVRKSHTLKVGFEVQAQRNNITLYDNSGGNFTFDRLTTGQPGVSRTGNAFASFLLGDIYSGFALFPGLQSGSRGRYYSPWVNDDWKVTSKLSLMLGLRYEVQPPYSDPNNRLSWMDPNVPNPGIGGYKGAQVFAGNGPGRIGSSTIGKTHWRDFSPRFGFAYRLLADTVIRGGYGRFFGQLATFNGSAGVPTDGFNASPSFVSGDSGITPAFNWDSGFPQNFARPPLIDPTIDNGLVAYLNNQERMDLLPYTHQINLMIERQVGRSFSVSGGYVAALGHRLIADSRSYGDPDWNQVSPSYLSLGSLLTQNILAPAVVAAGFREPFPGFAALWGTRATLAQALRRFPQYSNVYENVQRASYFNSSYHAFQLKAQKEVSHNFSFTVAYTFSKMLSDYLSGTRDWYNRHLDRGLDSGDRPQILTFSYVFQLPFGQGQALLNRKGLADKVVGGWKVSGVHSYVSGSHISVSVPNTLPLFNPRNFPDIVSNNFAGPKGSGGFDPGRGDLWLNPAAFKVPAANTFGNAPVRLGFRGPMAKNESFALLKDAVWSERYRLQFRMELTNPLNRVVFGGPGSNISSASFGKITSAGAGRQIQFGLKFYF